MYSLIKCQFYMPEDARNQYSIVQLNHTTNVLEPIKKSVMKIFQYPLHVYQVELTSLKTAQLDSLMISMSIILPTTIDNLFVYLRWCSLIFMILIKIEIVVMDLLILALLLVPYVNIRHQYIQLIIHARTMTLGIGLGMLLPHPEVKIWFWLLIFRNQWKEPE